MPSCFRTNVPPVLFLRAPLEEESDTIARLMREFLDKHVAKKLGERPLPTLQTIEAVESLLKQILRKMQRKFHAALYHH